VGTDPHSSAAYVPVTSLTDVELSVLFALLGIVLELAGFALTWVYLLHVWREKWPGEPLLAAGGRRIAANPGGAFETRSGTKGNIIVSPNPEAPLAEQLEAVRRDLTETRRQFDEELVAMRNEFGSRLSDLTTADRHRAIETDNEARREARYALTAPAALVLGGIVLQLISVLIGP